MRIYLSRPGARLTFLQIFTGILILVAICIAAPSAVLGQNPAAPAPAAQAQSVGNQQPSPTAPPLDPASIELERHAIDWMIGVTIGFGVLSFLLIALIAGRVQSTFWKSADGDRDRDWRAYLMQLPLAIPEGSVRALASLFVIMFGLLALILQKQLNLPNVEAISGFVGIVITFYFTARGNEQVQRTTEAAQRATDAAQKAASEASNAISQSQSMVANATQSVASAASTLRSVGPAGNGVAQANGQAEDSTAKMRLLHDQLQVVRQVFGLLSGMDRGPDVVAGADKLAADADVLLGTIQSLLSGSPDPSVLAQVSEQTEQMIERLQNGGLQGLIASAIATVEAIDSPAKAKLQAACGGSQGLIAGIVLSGAGLLSSPQKFEDWVSALVRKPYSPALTRMSPDSNVSQHALSLSPLMNAHLNVGQALDLMQKVLQTSQNGELIISSELAHNLAATPPYSVPQDFVSEKELTEAIEEYRSVLAFLPARDHLEGQVDISGIGPEQTPAMVVLQSIADICFELGADPRAAAEFERLAFAVGALAKLPVAPVKLPGIVLDAVRDAITIARSNRESTDARRNTP
jgi:hypothetical protein